MPNRLNDKQQKFVEEYLKDFNATQAYRRAGYRATTSVRVNAHRLLTNPNVQEAIEMAKQKLMERTHIDQEMIIERLLQEANYHGPGASHSARVQALTQLGKSLGMFESMKKKSENIEITLVKEYIDYSKDKNDPNRIRTVEYDE